MATVNVVRKFRLNHEAGAVLEFEPGIHEMPDEIASHWFVQANSDKEAEWAAANAVTQEQMMTLIQRRLIEQSRQEQINREAQVRERDVTNKMFVELQRVEAERAEQAKKADAEREELLARIATLEAQAKAAADAKASAEPTKPAPDKK